MVSREQCCDGFLYAIFDVKYVCSMNYVTLVVYAQQPAEYPPVDRYTNMGRPAYYQDGDKLGNYFVR